MLKKLVFVFILFASLTGILVNSGVLRSVSFALDSAKTRAQLVPKVPNLSEEEQFLSVAAYDLRSVETKGELLIGDTVLMKMEGVIIPISGLKDGGEGSKTQDPPSVKTLNRDFEVKVQWIAKALNDSGLVISPLQERGEFKEGEFWLAVVPVKSGNLALPSLPIFLKSDQHAAGGVGWRTNPLFLTIKSSLESEDPNQKSVDFRAPLETRVPALVWVFLCVLIIALLLLVTWIWKRSRKGRLTLLKTEEVKPLLPEDQEALMAFLEIESKGYLKDEKVKLHYFGVSDVLKRYLSRRYEVDAVEATTFELVRILRNHPVFEQRLLGELRDLFDGLDLVKFSDYSPPPERSRALILECRKLIERTKRLPEVVSSDSIKKSIGGT